MSLISLSSNSKDDVVQQQPHNFTNYFPQPIHLHKKSQVALVNFYHYRDEGYYRVDDSNKIIGFSLGADSKITGYNYAVLIPDKYQDGFALADEVARAMNAAVVQQNYTFSCTFVKGNLLANPQILDNFTISYDHVTAPLDKGGLWSKLVNETGNELIITNNDTDNNKSTIQPASSQTETKTAVMRRGVLTHKGTYEVLGISKAGGNELADVKLHGLKCGIVRNLFSKRGTRPSNADFDPNFADILVEVNTDDVTLLHEITISTLNQRNGTKSILSDNGKLQTERRKFSGTFINTTFNQTDLIGIKFIMNAKDASVKVQLLKSVDGGSVYTSVANNNTDLGDGGKSVYSATIDGSMVGGLIYDSKPNSIPNAIGGGKVAGIGSANLMGAIKCPFIPFLSIDNDQQKITGVNLNNIQITSQFFNASQNFVLQLDDDDAGMKPAYDYAIGVVTIESTAGAVTSSEFAGTALLTKADSLDGTTFNVYPNKGVDPNPADIIGTAKFQTNGDGTQASILFEIASLAAPSMTFVSNLVPPITKSSATFQVSGVFNHALRETQFTSQGIEKDFKSTNHNEDDLNNTSYEETGLVGADLNVKSVYLLNRLQQTDINGHSISPANLSTTLKSGTAAGVLGFRDNFVLLLSTVKSFTSDGVTTKAHNDNNIHISIPELPGVKSFEGEQNNIAKTIKIIPKNEFSKDETTGSMTYTASYEDYIDINNAEELNINSLSIQVRNPDGTMAKDLQPITRATIKFRQDPIVAESEQRMKEMDRFSRSIASKTNSNEIVNVKYTGS